jgi:hypothetical protein
MKNQQKLDPEVQQLADLMANAANSSPDLWKSIERSVGVAEFTSNCVLEMEREGTEVSSETETSILSPAKELQ